MIEAVNSVIANAALVRGVAEQASSARLDSYSPAEDRRKIEAPVAPYVSPYIKVDTQFDTAVLQIRDSATGDVIDQFPRETTLAARQREQALRDIEQRRLETEAASRPVRSAESAARETANLSPSPSATFVAQQAATPSAPSASDAQLASVAFTAGAQSGVTTSQGVSVTA